MAAEAVRGAGGAHPQAWQRRPHDVQQPEVVDLHRLGNTVSDQVSGSVQSARAVDADEGAAAVATSTHVQCNETFAGGFGAVTIGDVRLEAVRSERSPRTAHG